MNKFQKLTKIRETEVDGFKDWTWTEVDTGAWDGPVKDWESSHVHKFFQNVKNFNTVVTAGGNQGLYTRLYTKYFKKVYSFEPDPLNFHCLVMNNQTPNVIKMNCALGDYPAKLVSVNRQSETNSGMHKIAEETSVEGIPSIPLDSFHFETLDLLQLDVEGYELRIIDGAMSTIAEHKPVIIVENGNSETFMRMLGHLGYEKTDQSISDTIYATST